MSKGKTVRKVKKRWWILLLAVICILAASAASLYCSMHGLSVSYYQLSSAKLTSSIRIVQLTDLHNNVFGSDNERLIEKVKEQEPDLILITGDLLNEDEERTDIAADLIKALSECVPVYVSYGNHEKGHELRFDSDLKKLYSDAGAVVLEFEWQDITIHEQALRIGGLYGYCLSERLVENVPQRAVENKFLKEFQDTDSYRILMCHMPVAWIEMRSLEDWDMDCVLCGHSHGGQVRFPVIGGLWAPDQDWFPGKEAGIYYSSDQSKAMVLSRGLGSTEKIPRFNNIPEILVLDLNPEDSTVR